MVDTAKSAVVTAKREYHPKPNIVVIPAKAGIQNQGYKTLDASFRWHDKTVVTAANGK